MSLTEPVILVLRSVDVCRNITVVVSSEGEVQALGEEVTLLILHRGHQ